jgi:hypothetical protein
MGNRTAKPKASVRSGSVDGVERIRAVGLEIKLSQEPRS